MNVDLSPVSSVASQARVVESVANLSLDALEEPTDLHVKASASDGMADDSLLHLQVIGDRTPQLKFVAPEEDTEAIATAELRFTLEAFDDYGLSTVGIRYRIDDGPEQTLWESDTSDIGNAMANTVMLPLEDLNVSYPQAITYYAYAIDNREPERQRTTSELRFIDIRPFSREYEFKEGECNCQGECLTLEKLITEQREILGRTFASVQRGQTPDGLAAKLADDESELRTQTEDLTTALEEKVGPMPSLAEATKSMAQAEADLRAESMADGQVDEEHALAHLIAARRNLRKIMKQGNAQGKMARNVDQQQLKKRRKPQPDPKQMQEQEQQLSELRKQLDQLAKQQESFCQSAQASQQASQSSGKASASAEPATRDQLAEQQKQAAKETREIQRALEEGDYGQLAPRRAEQAAESIQESGQALAESDAFSLAIDQAREAAEQLKSLSRLLGRRHDPDFTDKLSVAERQARQLSEEQSELSSSLTDNGLEQVEPASSSANSDETALTEQQRLADGTEELVDLLDQLLADSIQQSWEMQQELAQQLASTPPQDASSAMRQAIETLKAGDAGKASAHGTRASAALSRLADGLRQARDAAGPNRLEQLTKAEKQAAAILKDLQREGSTATQAMARSEARQFADELRSLSKNDAELAAASRNLNASRPGTSSNTERSEATTSTPDSGQFATPPTSLVDSLREVDVILQRRIQQAIVNGTIQQGVGAVPPEYSDMVDDYYRTLSEDIE